MILDTGTLIAIVIALGGSLTVMCLFWKQNIAQQKEDQHPNNRILRKLQTICNRKRIRHHQHQEF